VLGRELLEELLVVLGEVAVARRRIARRRAHPQPAVELALRDVDADGQTL
jgi:hypothetical protein